MGTLTANGGPGQTRPRRTCICTTRTTPDHGQLSVCHGRHPSRSVCQQQRRYCPDDGRDGARFYTTDNRTFYAVATVDSENAPTHSPRTATTATTGASPWCPRRFMSQWLIVGWAPGDDPTFLGTAPENTAPIWLTGGHPIGAPASTPSTSASTTAATAARSPTWSPARTYDRKITGMAPRTQLKVYNGGTPCRPRPDRHADLGLWPDLTQRRRTADAILTAAWGEDPLTAAPASRPWTWATPSATARAGRLQGVVCRSTSTATACTTRATRSVTPSWSTTPALRAILVNTLTIQDTLDPGTTLRRQLDDRGLAQRQPRRCLTMARPPSRWTGAGYTYGRALPVPGSRSPRLRRDDQHRPGEHHAVQRGRPN